MGETCSCCLLRGKEANEHGAAKELQPLLSGEGKAGEAELGTGFHKDAAKKTGGETKNAQLQDLSVHKNAQKEASSAEASELLEALEILRAGLELRPGAPVTLRDLKAAPSLNGVRGVLQEFDSHAGRWLVQLASGELKRVRPANLLPDVEETE